MSTREYREVVATRDGRYLTLADLVAQAAVAGTPPETVVRVKAAVLEGSAVSRVTLRWQEGHDGPAEGVDDGE